MRKSLTKKNFTAFDTRLITRFVLGTFIFVGFLSTYKLAQLSQDNRNYAMEPTGLVEIRPQNLSAFIPTDTPTPLVFQINTKGVPIKGAQLVFKLSSGVVPYLSDTDIITTNSRLTIMHKSVTPLTDGYEIKMALIPVGTIGADLHFVNTSFEDLVQISLKPSKAGTIGFIFNENQSVVLDQNQADVLKVIPSFTLTSGTVLTPTAYTTDTPLIKSPTPALQMTVTPLPTKQGKRKGQR